MVTTREIKCQKCGKGMISSRFYCDEGFFDGWKCLWCGTIVDPEIISNRGMIIRNPETSTTEPPISYFEVEYKTHRLGKSWKDEPFL